MGPGRKYKYRVSAEKEWRSILLHPSFYSVLVAAVFLSDSLLNVILHPVNFESPSFYDVVRISFLGLGFLFFLLTFQPRQKTIIHLTLLLILVYPAIIIYSDLMDARISVHYVPIAFLLQIGQQNKKLSYEGFIGYIALLLVLFLSIVLRPKIDLDVTSFELKIQIIYSMALSAVIILFEYLWQRARSYYLTIDPELTDKIGRVTSSFAQIDVRNGSIVEIKSIFKEKVNSFFSECDAQIYLEIEEDSSIKEAPLSKEIIENLIKKKKAVLLQKTDHIKHESEHYSSSLIIPIIGKNKLLGLIKISHPAHFYFNEAHIRLAEIIASLIGSKILEYENKILEIQSLETELESLKLQELDELKSHFINNISRDIQTPLQLISAPSSKLAFSDGAHNKMAKLIHSSANQLKEILDQLLELGEIDITANQLNVEKIDIGSLIHIWSENFQHSARQKEISFVLNGPKSLELLGDRKKLTSIIHNLVNNAIKYTPENGTIEVKYALRKNLFQIEIHDSGTGIPTAHREKVFDRFYRIGDADGKGTGIGLSIVKELTEIMGGSIHISESHLGGTQFSFSYNIHYIEGMYPPNSDKTHSNEVLTHTEEQPLILVVDDHEDMRKFICACLDKDFTCMEAENGEQGFKIAQKRIPDLIITDLMMPKMNGEELCKNIRSNRGTSHIPIVVLTAKSNQSDKINMYENGADNYLTKPFESDELRAIIKTLIQSRNQARDKFRDKFIETPHLDAVYEHQETPFIEIVVQTIETNMDDSSFNILALCNELNMGRNQLQRKIKALTDLTPVEFVRSVRLKKAAALLLETDLNVSEVAYSTGFNNLSYFTKVFKQMFKCLPSQYINKTEHLE